MFALRTQLADLIVRCRIENLHLTSALAVTRLERFEIAHFDRPAQEVLDLFIR
jgi:hypothetical protein